MLEKRSHDVSDLNAGEKIWVDRFVKFNTTIPSSAAVERLFSIDRDILRDKRASLSDQSFERLIFLKRNMHLNLPSDRD